MSDSQPHDDELVREWFGLHSRLGELSHELRRRGRDDLLRANPICPCQGVPTAAVEDLAAVDNAVDNTDAVGARADGPPSGSLQLHPARRSCLIAENATDMIWTIGFAGDEEMSRLLRDDEPRAVARHLLTETRLNYVSPASRSLLGYEPDELQLMPLERILTSESLAVAKTVLAEELSRERRGGSDPARQRTVELKHVCSNGATRSCEVNARFLRDANDVVAGLFGITRDISARKNAEHAAERAVAHMRRFHDTINRSPAVVYRCRVAEGWPVDFVSEKVSQFGYAPKDFVSGRVSWSSLTHPDDVDRVAAEVRRHRAEDVREFTLEYRLLTKKGEVRWIEDRILVVSEMDGVARFLQGIVLDVTERREAEEALRESSATMLQLFTNLPDFVLVVDRSGKIQFVNRGAPGVPEEELVGTVGFDHLLPEYRPKCRHALWRALATGEVQRVEARTVYDRWWDCRVVPMPGGERSESAMIICTDVTESRLAEQELRKSEERLRLIADNVTDIVWVGHVEGVPDLAAFEPGQAGVKDAGELLDRFRFTFYSPSVEQILGYTVEEALQLRVADIMTPASYEILKKRYAAAVAALKQDPLIQTRHRTIELEYRRRDGEGVWCEITRKFLRDGEGRVIGTEGVTRDISLRKSLERELSETVTRQQQRMGRELHDEVGQQLVGSRLLAKGLQQRLEAHGLPESARAAELVEVLSAAESHVRALIKGVRPVEVDAAGLMAALTDLAESTARLSNVRCTFTCDKPVPVEDNYTATQLFYIAREAVQNAVKHATANQVNIGLEARQDHLRVCVVDDGVGLPAAAGESGGMGLRIMRHRASVIGAELRLDRLNRGGTQVTCVLPREPAV